MIEEESQLREIVEKTTRLYEGTRTEKLLQRWPEEFVGRMLNGIVGFEVEVTRLEGKFKLGQNRTAADRRGVLKALKESPNRDDQALGEFMENHGLGK